MNKDRLAEPVAEPRAKATGMRDIAEALGVSTGTVDRALHNKPGINAITRQRVLSMAQNMGYRPNLAARYLSSRKEIRVAVNLPRTSALFFDEVLSGIEEAARPFESGGARVILRRYSAMCEGEVEAFEAALADNVQGLIICPGDPLRLKAPIHRAAQRGIPVLCVTTDAPETDRLASVFVDHFVNGSIVAELMGQFLPDGGRVLVVTGSLTTFDHAEKVRGFKQCASSLFPRLEIAEVFEDHEDLEQLYAKCRNILSTDQAIRGVYAATVNSLPILRAVEELGMAGKIKVITTDLYPDLVRFLRCRVVAATIYQRPFNQGRIGFHTIYRFIADGICPPRLIRLSPQVVLRSNLDVFLEHGQIDRAGKRREMNPVALGV